MKPTPAQPVKFKANIEYKAYFETVFATDACEANTRLNGKYELVSLFRYSF